MCLGEVGDVSYFAHKIMENKRINQEAGEKLNLKSETERREMF